MIEAVSTPNPPPTVSTFKKSKFYSVVTIGINDSNLVNIFSILFDELKEQSCISIFWAKTKKKLAVCVDIVL